MSVKTTLGNLTETANEITAELKLKDLSSKVILNSYYFYVRSCIDLGKEILIGSDWYEQIYKLKK